MLDDRVAVGHARNIIRYHSGFGGDPTGRLRGGGGGAVLVGQQVGVAEEDLEEFAEDTARLGGHPEHAVMAVDAFVQETLEFEVLGSQVGAHGDQGPTTAAHLVDVRGRALGDQLGAVPDHVPDDPIDHSPYCFMGEATRGGVGVFFTNEGVVAREQGHLRDLIDGDQPRPQAVVDIVVVVGDLVGEVGQLGLEAGLLAAQEPLSDLSQFAGLGRRAMLEDALAGLEREVEPGELGIAFLELVDHPQRLEVVLEAAVVAHAFVQGILPRMAKRGVPEVMGEADGLGQRLVQAQGACDGPRDLRNLERVGDPGAIEVALVVHEHLGLVDEPPERVRMHDAVAVALVFTAELRRRLVAAAAASGRVVRRIRSEREGHAGVLGARRRTHEKKPARVASRASSG